MEATSFITFFTSMYIAKRHTIMLYNSFDIRTLIYVNNVYVSEINIKL